MNFVEGKKCNVFVNVVNGNVFYVIGLSKKDMNGNYINGTINCKFKKGTEPTEKCKIVIKNAWLDFYIKEVERNGKKAKETVPFIFINEYTNENEENFLD